MSEEEYDCKLPAHEYRLIKLRELSPISSDLRYSPSDNAPSDFDCSLPNSDHSSSNCVVDSFIMHSPSNDPSSPEYRPQLQFHPRSERSYTVNPVPTLVCGVPTDIISVPHHFNHVPPGPLIPRQHIKVERTNSPTNNRQGGTDINLLHISGSSGKGVSTVIIFVITVLLLSLRAVGLWYL